VAAATRRVEAEPFDPERWAPYGWVPVADTDPADGDHRLTYEWADAHVNVISHAADEVEHRPDGLRCTGLFRHRTHTQVLMVLNCAAVVAVAPADTAFDQPADVDRIEAFLLRPHDMLVLDRGTWHWGPFPLGDEPVRLFNVQGLRYAEDNDRADLEGLGVVADVVVSGG